MSPIRYLLPSVAFAALIAAGCADSPTGAADRGALLAGSWRTESYHQESRVDTLILVFADIFTFRDDGSYITQTRFDSTYITGLPGRWRLVGNGRQLVLDPGTPYQAVWSVDRLSATDLNISTKLNVNDVLVSVEYHAVRQ